MKGTRLCTAEKISRVNQRPRRPQHRLQREDLYFEAAHCSSSAGTLSSRRRARCVSQTPSHTMKSTRRLHQIRGRGREDMATIYLPSRKQTNILLYIYFFAGTYSYIYIYNQAPSIDFLVFLHLGDRRIGRHERLI
jgi:hypothetical protein